MPRNYNPLNTIDIETAAFELATLLAKISFTERQQVALDNLKRQMDVGTVTPQQYFASDIVRSAIKAIRIPNACFHFLKTWWNQPYELSIDEKKSLVRGFVCLIAACVLLRELFVVLNGWPLLDGTGEVINKRCTDSLSTTNPVVPVERVQRLIDVFTRIEPGQTAVSDMNFGKELVSYIGPVNSFNSSSSAPIPGTTGVQQIPSWFYPRGWNLFTTFKRQEDRAVFSGYLVDGWLSEVNRKFSDGLLPIFSQIQKFLTPIVSVNDTIKMWIPAALGQFCLLIDNGSDSDNGYEDSFARFGKYFKVYAYVFAVLYVVLAYAALSPIVGLCLKKALAKHEAVKIKYAACGLFDQFAGPSVGADEATAVDTGDSNDATINTGDERQLHE